LNSNNKNELIRLAIKVTLILVAIFVFINIVKIFISQSLFFIADKYGDKAVWIIVGLIVLYEVVNYIVKFFKKRNQDTF